MYIPSNRLLQSLIKPLLRCNWFNSSTEKLFCCGIELDIFFVSFLTAISDSQNSRFFLVLVFPTSIWQLFSNISRFGSLYFDIFFSFFSTWNSKLHCIYVFPAAIWQLFFSNFDVFLFHSLFWRDFFRFFLEIQNYFSRDNLTTFFKNCAFFYFMLYFDDFFLFLFLIWDSKLHFTRISWIFRGKIYFVLKRHSSV